MQSPFSLPIDHVSHIGGGGSSASSSDTQGNPGRMDQASNQVPGLGSGLVNHSPSKGVAGLVEEDDQAGFVEREFVVRVVERVQTQSPMRVGFTCLVTFFVMVSLLRGEIVSFDKDYILIFFYATGSFLALSEWTHQWRMFGSPLLEWVPGRRNLSTLLAGEENIGGVESGIMWMLSGMLSLANSIPVNCLGVVLLGEGLLILCRTLRVALSSSPDGRPAKRSKTGGAKKETEEKDKTLSPFFASGTGFSGGGLGFGILSQAGHDHLPGHGASKVKGGKAKSGTSSKRRTRSNSPFAKNIFGTLIVFTIMIAVGGQIEPAVIGENRGAGELLGLGRQLFGGGSESFQSQQQMTASYRGPEINEEYIKFVVQDFLTNFGEIDEDIDDIVDSYKKLRILIHNKQDDPAGFIAERILGGSKVSRLLIGKFPSLRDEEGVVLCSLIIMLGEKITAPGGPKWAANFYAEKHRVQKSGKNLWRRIRNERMPSNGEEDDVGPPGNEDSKQDEKKEEKEGSLRREPRVEQTGKKATKEDFWQKKRDAVLGRMMESLFFFSVGSFSAEKWT